MGAEAISAEGWLLLSQDLVRAPGGSRGNTGSKSVHWGSVNRLLSCSNVNTGAPHARPSIEDACHQAREHSTTKSTAAYFSNRLEREENTNHPLSWESTSFRVKMDCPPPSELRIHGTVFTAYQGRDSRAKLRIPTGTRGQDAWRTALQQNTGRNSLYRTEFC